MFNYAKYNLGLEGFNFGKVKNCPIFLKDTQILRPYVAPDNVKSEPELQKYYAKFGYNYGVDLVPYNDSTSLTKADYAIKTYSPAIGVVLDISDFKSADGSDSKAVVIQYDADTSFRVSNLTEITVSRGTGIDQGELIGYSKKFVHLEMLTFKREYDTAQSYVFRKLRLYVSNPMRYFTENYSGVSYGVGE